MAIKEPIYTHSLSDDYTMVSDNYVTPPLSNDYSTVKSSDTPTVEGKKEKPIKNMVYNEPKVLNIADMETGTRMLDKLTRVKVERRVQPLDYYDNIIYPHRAFYDMYNLRIGDVWFMIPPEFIMVQSESITQKISTLRQENTQKSKSGYHRRNIIIDLVFHGHDSINGFKVVGPEGYYYVDGLRQLFAEFKCTPFLPITNELINVTYGIFTVVLQSITISTMSGFPDTMTAQISLQEINMMPYIEMPDLAFKYMIDWDLFRFYYQRLLTDTHEYRKLQSLPANKEYNHFKLSILSDEAFEDTNETNYLDKEYKYNMYDIITDKVKVCTNQETNYITWVDSTVDDAKIVEFQCGYSNLLANLQMSDANSPTVQYMGGMDTIYNITIETTDINVVQSLEQCQIANDILTRKNIKIHSCGFVKLESELVEFTGSLFVMIDTINVNTVPGFPGLFHIQMQCVGFDMWQSERETLNGFRPFACGVGAKSDEKSNGTSDYHDIDNDNGEIHWEQAIEQDPSGVLTKVQQDNYTEAYLRAHMEIYPDLRLPTYKETDEFISKCIAFRKEFNLSDLPYKKYPTNPTNILYNSFSAGSTTAPGVRFHPSDIDTSLYEYDLYVDPDFYVFYHDTYASYLEEDKDYYGYTPIQRDTIKKNINTYDIEGNNDNWVDNTPTSSTVTNNIIKSNNLISTGNKFVSSYNKTTTVNKKYNSSFDYVQKLLKEQGLISQSYVNFYNLKNSGLFTTIKHSEALPNDLVCADGKKDVGIYAGNNKYWHLNTKNNKWELATLTNPSSRTFVRYTGGATTSDIKNADISNNIVNTDSSYKSTSESTAILTEDEFDAICKAVAGETEDEGSASDRTIEKAVAQVIYDRLTNGYGTLNQILASPPFSGKTGTVTESIKSNVKKVFCDGNKYLSSKIVTNFLTSDNSVSDFATYNKYMTRVGKVDDHTFWGKSTPSSKVQYTIVDKKGIGSVNITPTKTDNNVEYDSITMTSNDLKYFAEPSICNTSELTKTRFVRDELNDYRCVYNSSFCDMYQYSARGRLVRAFPAYLFCILDDNAQWFDGRKLWTNFYVYRSIIDINTHAANDMPIETATLTITNYYHNLDRTQRNLPYTSLSDAIDDSNLLGKVVKGIYKYTGMFISLGMKLTDKLIKVHQMIYDHAKLREGARIHLRIGYGSDPMSLAPVLNGHISDITIGEQVSIVAMSDGNELINHITSAKEHDVDTGWLGLFGLGAVQESSNIIAHIMTQRQSWMSHLHKNIYEGSKYGIEHYGIYFRQTLFGQKASFAAAMTGIVGGSVGALGGVVTGNPIGVATGAVSGAAIGTIAGGAVGTIGDIVTGSGGVNLEDIWNDRQEFYDILKNVYVGNYDGISYVCRDYMPIFDGEQNVAFNKYNMTPWDVFQVATQNTPEYIFKSSYHQFDSRVYYGLPCFMEKFRYDYFGGIPGTSEGMVNSGGSSQETTVKGDSLSNGAKFENGASEFRAVKQGKYENGQWIKGMKKVIFRIQLPGHNNGSRSDPDKVIITLHDSSGRSVPCEVFSGNLGSGLNVLCVPDDVIGGTGSIGSLENYDYADFFVHVPSSHVNCCQKATVLDWEIIYDDVVVNKQNTKKTTQKVTYKNFGEVLYEECKTAAQVHYLDSLTSIIDNQIRVTSKFSSTNVKVMYVRGNKPVSTAVLHSDDTIDFAYQKTTILDSPIVQDALGPDALWEFLGYKIGKESATRIGISTLIYGWNQQYQGQLILYGWPGIKPNDYMMINDTFSYVYGLSFAREVIHSFSSMTGFTTSVTPGMIAFDTHQNSGLIVHCQNLLGTLNVFSAITNARRQLVKTHTQYYSIDALSDTMMEKYKHGIMSVEATNQWHENVTTATHIFTGVWTVSQIYEATSLMRNTLKIKDFAALKIAAKGLYSSVVKTIKRTRRAYHLASLFTKSKVVSVKFALEKLRAGIGAIVAPTGIGAVVWFAVSIIIDKLITSVFEWLDNRNVIVLLPMWWENSAFVSGVHSGEKILLMGDYLLTDENDQGDAIGATNIEQGMHKSEFVTNSNSNIRAKDPSYSLSDDYSMAPGMGGASLSGDPTMQDSWDTKK